MSEYGDVRDLLGRMPASPYDTFDGTYVFAPDLFPVKHRLLAELNAQRPVRSIVETGAYFGAFLLTALDACPDLLWLRWIDNESYTSGSNELCRRNLGWWMDIVPGGERLRWATGRNPTDLYDWLDVRVDVVHVDGDHSYPGCFHDLTVGLSMRPRQLWVDDYGSEEGVTRAVLDFSEHVGLPFEIKPTTNGLAVFEVRG